MNADDTTWTLDRGTRWERIRTHPIGGSAAAEFATRLQREQGWSVSQTQEALREYRRFVFLACVAGHEVTPSKAVDAVWHLHLLHTRDYWQTFCPQVLGTDFHHEPSAGIEHAPRYRDQYAQTLASYARWFGPPPPAWWPIRKAAAPVRSMPRPRVSQPARAPRLAALLLGAALPALVWAARPIDPLEWRGGDFLALYALLMLAAAIVGIALRIWLRRQASPSNRHVGALSPVEAAYLAGGPHRAVDAAIADLHAQGAIEWDARGERFVRTEAARDLRAPLDRIARAMLDETDLAKSVAAAAQALTPIQTDLERRGLWLTREDARRIGKIAALPALAVGAFGLVKIVLGIVRDKPVSFLVVMCGLTALLALMLYLVRPGRSRLGDQEVARLRTMHASHGARPGPSQLAFAVALGGSAILTGTALAAYHDARGSVGSSGDGSSSSWSSDSDSNRSGSDSSSDSSGDSGSDGGSSGCGGCGGGGGD